MRTIDLFADAARRTVVRNERAECVGACLIFDGRCAKAITRLFDALDQAVAATLSVQFELGTPARGLRSSPGEYPLLLCAQERQFIGHGNI